MLKKRITASLIVKGGRVVQSIGFDRYLPIGSVKICVEFLNAWGIDEIIILDIDATAEARKPDIDFITNISHDIFVPLAVGGCITGIDDIRHLIQHGADKVSINKAAFENPNIIKEAAQVFGAQCIVVSIDAKQKSDGSHEVFLDSGKTATGVDVIEFAKKVEKLGAGEILLNSIDRDGSKKGYDLQLVEKVASVVSLPVIALGGAGQPEHFFQVLQAGASAAAAGNFFHFTEHSPITLKSYLRTKGVLV